MVAFTTEAKQLGFSIDKERFMKLRYILLAAAIGLATAGACLAIDSVKTTTTAIPGKITSISRTAVEVERNGVKKSIAVNEIVAVFFDDEPTLLKTARSHLRVGRYEDAREALGKIPADDVSGEFIPPTIAFYKAYCAAQLALGGTGTIKDAGGMMNSFAKDYPQSYHYFQAYEVLGDLLVASGSFQKAEAYYARVGKAPWPDYQMRANVARGRAQLAQGKTGEALQSFESVLAAGEEGELAQLQRQAATLGKARCIAAGGKPDEAIKMVETVLGKADPEQIELHAEAYNTLGSAHRKAGRTNEALLAFLHVDLLYFSQPEAHAEALANLADLWDEVHKTQRAVRARRILEERYRNSRWSKQGG